jgi:REP element-mobilizing transposase RayT
MAPRKENFIEGEYYHLYNRGVEKINIFLDDSDFKKFKYLLYICNTKKSIVLRDLSENFERGEPIVDVGAFCIMKNHFHILLKEKIDGGITLFMRKLMTAYSMYFNKKNKRTGKLWQGVFKSKHIDSDNYLKYTFSYIHLNPAKYIDKNWKENSKKDAKKIFDFVFNYKYSSLQIYSKVAKGYDLRVLNMVSFPSYFKNPEEHKKELLEWLHYNP